MLVTVKDLVKTYPSSEGTVRVLDGVDVSMAPGDTVAITGESGSGKSTLLHIIAGLETADSGTLIVDGTDMAGADDETAAALRRQTLSVIFQQFNLIPSLTVSANIAFQARLAGSYDAAQATALASRLGLSKHLNKYPEELSGGQQQRVAIARAIAARPRLLLADEPTGNLDEGTGDAVIEEMFALVKEQGTSLLLVTHSMRLAERASRRLTLRKGRFVT
ncbi:MAG: ABC transporter ATP-binding protein [Pseudomonadota bacterium]